MLKRGIFFVLLATIALVAQGWSIIPNQLLSHAKKIANSKEIISIQKIAGTVGVAVALVGVVPSASNAAQYGGFGGSYAEVVNPKDAVLNVETQNTDDVKAGREGVQGLLKSVEGIRAQLKSNNQAELQNPIRSELSVGKVRDVLNKYNSAFDEDTQRGTDRLIRNVIQYLTELDRDIVVKAGKQRSEVKVNNILRTLDSLDNSLKELSSFYPK